MSVDKAASSHVGGSTVEFKDWWLDRSFGRIPIAATAKPGENIVTLTARLFTVWHEVEAAFILGDFALKPVEHGFVGTPNASSGLLECAEQLTHSINPDGTAWLSGGIGFQKDTDGVSVEDRQPHVVFGFGAPTKFGVVRIWNYNESHVRDLTSRGAKAIRLRGTVGSRSDAFDLDFGVFTFDRATANSSGQELRLNRARARYVRLEILSNQNGIGYPAGGQVEDNRFVGLAEVEFFSPTSSRISAVKIASVSGEPASHRRQAVHLVDGSGLVDARPGWNERGHPFYSSGVSYRQQFVVRRVKGEFSVALLNWRGSVAQVCVNGKSAGHTVSAAWECDVTKFMKPGLNDVEVVVVGTLKNTLGPHHGNPSLVTAWPAMCRNGLVW